MIGDSCKTIDGNTPNKPCVFPFIDAGTIHTKCTQVDGDPMPWCATEVDENGQLRDWGHCATNCPVEP